MSHVYVKPAPGLLVRDEYTLIPIPADGASVLMTRYVQRRITDGDLIVCEPPAPPAAVVEGPAPSKSKKSSTSDQEG